MPSARTAPAPEPAQIYERTRTEGRRRLSRPLLELAAIGLVGGFDVAFGVVAFGLAAATIDGGRSEGVGHLVGTVAFGIGFVFVVVGRSELFTENLLVPIAGLVRTEWRSWLKLGELWVATLVLNLAGGVLLARSSSSSACASTPESTTARSSPTSTSLSEEISSAAPASSRSPGARRPWRSGRPGSRRPRPPAPFGASPPASAVDRLSRASRHFRGLGVDDHGCRGSRRAALCPQEAGRFPVDEQLVVEEDPVVALGALPCHVSVQHIIPHS